MKAIVAKVATNKAAKKALSAFTAIYPFVLIALLTYYGLLLRDIYLYSKVNAEVQRGLMMQERVLREMTDAESGHRGYIFSGDPRYLAQYDAAIEDLRRDRLPFIVYLEHHKYMTKYASVISRLLDSKLSEMRSVMTVYHGEGAAQAQAMVRTHHGYDLMEENRDVLNRMRVEQTEYLRQSQLF